MVTCILCLCFSGVYIFLFDPGGGEVKNMAK